MCYFLTDDFAQAVATLEPLRDSQKTNLDFLYVLGIAYQKLRRTEDAAQTFGQLVGAGGNSAQLHLLMGKAHLDLSEISLAQAELEKAVALDPSLHFAHYNLGVVYQKQGKLALAADQYKLEMSLTPDDPASAENLGSVYLEQGDPDGALASFRQALKIDPKLPKSWDGMGKAYLRKNLPEQAIPCFQRALNLAPDSAKMHFQLGQAYLKIGAREKAQKEISEAGRLQAKARKKFEDTVSGKLPPPQAPTGMP
jgi:tetratricopeptide (TPR) repeat protein